ncbi:MAG: flagellar hook-length control protein FliK [Arcobacteraceae bacterium]|jgi:hypothetical protein|nr:flagellar hook-length control protein FliK [Arcobacteraceae bacterium]MDY0365561.1 flagellar hook-length control protein FliK [Arcobacteraceae bacterium]
MTQELSLFDTLLNTSKQKVGESKTQKEGSSLFDDMLKNISQQPDTSTNLANSFESEVGLEEVFKEGLIKEKPIKLEQKNIQENKNTQTLIKESENKAIDTKTIVQNEQIPTKEEKEPKVSTNSSLEILKQVNNLKQDKESKVDIDKTSKNSVDLKTIIPSLEQDNIKEELPKKEQVQKEEIVEAKQSKNSDKKDLQENVSIKPIEIDKKESIGKNNELPIKDKEDISLLDKLIKEALPKIKEEINHQGQKPKELSGVEIIKDSSLEESNKIEKSTIKSVTTKDQSNIEKEPLLVQDQDTLEQKKSLDSTIDKNINNITINIDSSEKTAQDSKDLAKVEAITNRQNLSNIAVPQELLLSQEVVKTEDITTSEINTNSKIESKVEKDISLLDKLLQESLKTVSKEQNSTLKEFTKEMFVDEKILVKIKDLDSSAKSELLESIYKSSVSKNISLAAISNAFNAKEIALNASSVGDLQKSADMLGLNLESVEDLSSDDMLESNIDIKKESLKQSDISIARAAIEKSYDNKRFDIKNELIFDNLDNKINNTNQVKNEYNETTIQKVVEIQVSDLEVEQIQSKIIGAKQRLSSMMSDVARAMYTNYKPPMTAFRISLNPANLGTIAILIRSQRIDNSLNISMNLSQASTHEAMVSNQQELRNALQRSFENSSNFELEFKLDPDGQNQSSQENKQNSQENKEKEKDDEFISSSELIQTQKEAKYSATYF